MTNAIDLRPAAQEMARLIAGTPDASLRDPTPCADFDVRHLLEHVANSARTFTNAARKSGDEAQPPGDGSELGDDWRTRLPRELAALVVAWRQPGAWDGMTQAAGVDLPGERAGRFALDEIFLHSWDLARATGQELDHDEASLRAVHELIAELNEPQNQEVRDRLFGPVVTVALDAPELDQVLALTGRDPQWSRPPRPAR
jgi:uncharacterized protein (TIGR03086 family)